MLEMFPENKQLVSLSGMVETPILQTEQDFDCRGATCHSGQRAGIQEEALLRFLDAPVSSTGQAYQVRHDSEVDFNQPTLENPSSYRRGLFSAFPAPLKPIFHFKQKIYPRLWQTVRNKFIYKQRPVFVKQTMERIPWERSKGYRMAHSTNMSLPDAVIPSVSFKKVLPLHHCG